jgi:aldose 1-epimerase
VNSALELRFGDYQAVVANEGAALKTLHFQGSEVVSVPQPVSDFSFAGSTIAPWPNRLEDASWTRNGEVLQGEVNERANNNALHGLTVRIDFELVGQSQSSASFRTVLDPSAVYPFRLELLVEYELGDAGLCCRFSARNLGGERAPLGYATHPYFAFDEGSELRVTARKASLNSERQLPIGEQNVSALGLATGEFVPISSLSLDDCIYDFAPGERVTSITRPTISRTVDVWQDENCGYQMLFTRRPKTVGDYPELLAVEPQTCPANALRSGTDLVWLAPGVSHSVSWGVRVS